MQFQSSETLPVKDIYITMSLPKNDVQSFDRTKVTKVTKNKKKFFVIETYRRKNQNSQQYYELKFDCATRNFAWIVKPGVNKGYW